MANILILNIIIPYPLHHNGNTVRVLPLSRELARQHRCYLAAFGEPDDRYRALEGLHEYEDILLLPPMPSHNPWWRHLFWRSGSLIKRLHPFYYRDCVNRLAVFASRHNIDVVLAHTMIASEFAENLPVRSKIVDCIDSRTLYLERRYAKQPGKKASHWEGLKVKRELARARYQESRLLNHFFLATTISSRDSETLLKLTGAHEGQIIDIPNGVSPDLEQWTGSEVSPKRSIAFWGALDFPPNATAVAYFYEQVFLPYLSKSGISWHIIGRNPGQEIRALAERHENIIVTGYVPDLFALVRDIPVVVNPMLIGGGLKNKVLEAFAMQRAVVSNRLGMEAIEAIPGKHYLPAETPEEFARQILELVDSSDLASAIGRNARELVLSRYTWSVIGERMNALIDSCLDRHPLASPGQVL